MSAVGELDLLAQLAAQVDLLEQVLARHPVEACNAECERSEGMRPVTEIAVRPLPPVDEELAGDRGAGVGGAALAAKLGYDALRPKG